MKPIIDIIIHSGVHLFNLPEELKAKVRKDLKFDNPSYINAKRFGKYNNPNMSPYLRFYSEIREEDVMFIPKGYFYFLLKHIKSLGLEYKIDDRTTVFPKLDFKFHGEARDYQELAIKDIAKYPIGTLEANTGAGKTVVGVQMITVRQQPTLIVVHSKELFNQWKTEIKKFLHYDVGQVGGGKFNIKDITIGLVMSVKNNLEELKDRFGFVILDECHRCPSSTFTEVVSKLSCRYQLGLSATQIRSDGLGYAIFAFIGPKIHSVSKDTLHDIGAVLNVEVNRIYTRFNYFFESNFQDLVNKLTMDKERNAIIVDVVIQDLKKHNSVVLVVSDRVAHCKALQGLLERKNVSSVVLTSNITDRESTVDSIRSGDYRVVIATTQLIGEGFSMNSLASLVLTTPIKFEGKLVQVVGRIKRPDKNAPNKIARVYDIRDDNVGILKNHGKIRDRAYKKM